MIINSSSSNAYYVDRNDSISRFYNLIQRYPILSVAEEVDLIEKYQNQGDMKAREKLVRCNQRFIFSAAKRFSNNAHTVMDLVDEGSMGLVEALDRYELDRGMRLLTFAQAYIRKRMIQYIIDNWLVKRLSDEKLANKISKERSLFFNKNGYYPTNEELKDILAEKYGVEIKDDCMVNDIEYSFIDEPKDDDGSFVSDEHEFNNATCSENEYIEQSRRSDLKAIILAALNQLCNEQERGVVKLLYGIDCDREHSVSEVADMYGVTETRINQIRYAVETRLKENEKFVYLVGA